MKTLLVVLALAAGAAAQPVCGDCDGDGSVTTLDALVAALGSVGLRVGGADMLACDVAAPFGGGGSHRMTILDALRIAQWSIGAGAPLVCV